MIKKILWGVLQWLGIYSICILLIQLCNPLIVDVAKYFQVFNAELIFNQVIWLIICLLLGIYCFVNRIISFNIALLVLAVYCTFRLYEGVHPGWTFIKFRSIYYLDILVLVLFLSSFIDRIKDWLHIITWKYKQMMESKENINKEEPKSLAIFSENSNPTQADDKFGFYDEAVLFLEKLEGQKKFYQDNALIVGLEGEWGSGKSFFISMIGCAISECNKSSQFKLVKFSSWNYRNSNQLTIELLSTISEAIGVKEVTKAIDKYIKVFEGTSFQWLAGLTRIFCGGDKTTQEYFNDVNEKLKYHNQTLIIAVDDIDRLVKEEVLEVLKLVRNTANFRNIVYVVAYDRSYVEETLKEYGISNSEKYLEKIFNVPFLLPEKSIERKKALYKEILQKNIFFNKTDKTDSGIAAFVDDFGEYLSIRNVKKLAKQLLINTPFIRKDGFTFELDIYDTLILYFLNIKYHKVYAHLSDIKSVIKESNNSKYLVAFNSYNTIVLNKFINPKDLENDEGISNEIYKEKRLLPYVEKSDLEFAYKLLTGLFGLQRYRTAYSISHIDAYPIYFNRVFPDNCIKVSDFISQSKSDNFSKVLSEWKDSCNMAILCNIIEYLDFSKYSNREIKRVINIIILEIATEQIYINNPNLRILGDNKFRIVPGINFKHNNFKALLNILDNTNVDNTFMQRFSILLDSRVYKLYNSKKYIELYRTYINNYLYNIHDYRDFNPEIWCSMVYLYQNINDSYCVEEVQNIFKSHLLQYIISFYNVYSDEFSSQIKEGELIKDSVFYNTYVRFVQLVFLPPSYSINSDNISTGEWMKKLIEYLENNNNKIADFFSQHLKRHYSIYNAMM